MSHAAVRLVALGVVLLFSQSEARAQARSCSGAGTQAAMNRCAGDELKAADAKLNKTYRELLASLSPAGASRLKEAQRAWIRFRDAECSFQSNGKDGGSIAPMVSAGCMTRLTQQRTSQLAAARSCPEGDVACPR